MGWSVRTAVRVAACALLTVAGCATESFEMDAKHPAEMASDGMINFRGRFYTQEDFPKALKRAHVPKDRTINIRVCDDISDPRMLRKARALIGKAGYHRVIFNSNVRAKSYQVGGGDPLKDSGRVFAPGEKVYGADW